MFIIIPTDFHVFQRVETTNPFGIHETNGKINAAPKAMAAMSWSSAAMPWPSCGKWMRRQVAVGVVGQRPYGGLHSHEGTQKCMVFDGKYPKCTFFKGKILLRWIIIVWACFFFRENLLTWMKNGVPHGTGNLHREGSSIFMGISVYPWFVRLFPVWDWWPEPYTMFSP